MRLCVLLVVSLVFVPTVTLYYIFYIKKSIEMNDRRIRRIRRIFLLANNGNPKSVPYALMRAKHSEHVFFVKNL